MIKLRSFWVALAMGCAVSLGTTSCGDDDDDEPKQEEVNTDAASDAGNVMKDVVEKYNDNKSNLLDQATSMTTDELQKLAQTVVEYNKNKNNAEWVEAFKNAAASTIEGQQSAVDLLNQAISQIENIGVDMNEITTQDLLDAFNQYFQGKDQLGDGEEAGYKTSEAHQETIKAVYNEKFASIPADQDHMSDMMAAFKGLDDSQKKEFVNLTLAWANKSDDAAWQDGFLKGTGLNETEQEGLREKLDFLAQYKSYLAAMA